MKPTATWMLLCVFLVPAVGIDHCPSGDLRAFSEPCTGSSSRPFPKVVSRETWSAGPGPQSMERTRLEVTACSTTYSRVANGAIEEFGPGRVELGEAKALHDALVEAGGLDADSAPSNVDCPVTSYSYWGDVTVYEPSPVPGGAWSNSFSFGPCATSPQAGQINALLDDWIAAHFDTSHPLPDVIPIPDGAVIAVP